MHTYTGVQAIEVSNVMGTHCLYREGELTVVWLLDVDDDEKLRLSLFSVGKMQQAAR